MFGTILQSTRIFSNRNISFVNQPIVQNALRSGVSRLYSTNNNNNGENVVKLRNVLKQFYQLVHPDTLANYPSEKKVNSHNMKIIMGVIDQYKKRPVPDPSTKPVAHPLTFFMIDKYAETRPNELAPLKRVDIEVIENSRNPNQVPDQLSKLFGMCHLPTKFITEIDQVDNFKQPKINGSIKDYLLDNRYAAKQMLVDSEKQKRDVENTLRKLRRELAVQLQMNVNPAETSFSFQENLNALQEFTDAYLAVAAEVPEKHRRLFKSLQFNLNYAEINYTSNEPVVYLDRGSPETWAGYLRRLDFNEIEDQVRQEKEENQKKVASFTKQKKEFDTNAKELEKLLRVRTVTWQYHDDPNDDPNHYLGLHDQMDLCQSFTGMLLKNKLAIQKIMKHGNYKFSRLTVGVAPNLRKSKFYIEMDGSLKVSTRCSFEDFMEILIDQYDNAIKVQKESEKIEQMRDYVQVRLGLRELTTLNAFIYSEGYEKVFKAYQKLYEQSEKLRNLELNGLSIIIADYYSISRTGEIYIKHDFSVEDFIAALSAPTSELQQEPEQQQLDLNNILMNDQQAQQTQQQQPMN
ncbi:hypothetical protein PPL_04678 [Heterostelium album PN500]|uniref:DUF4460 domain-containing protein n=1 Tax=Heterostelium pallidum (strain ATCC 26659 / Pp 5 / PN500) TaxID=670386 RepID=D3B887_HETP5|nr:hypothetical protein PPL_04678 [Heterostelium album PN500]EFA82255.1 hypothetical protein PPL_04678 [Heterostelium album PN500]|eukprot:XP_020434372.1 hypothetical protein PPL_04678 [Heterostelium album PN500]